jgi:enolase
MLPCCFLALLLTASLSRSASSFSEAMRMGAEVYHNLKNLIKEKYGELTALLAHYHFSSV